MSTIASLSIGPLPTPTTAAALGQGAPAPVSQEPEESRPNPQILFNPRIRFDSAASVMVMEFRNPDSGEVLRSVPSERQLQAYAKAQRLPGRDEQQDTSQERPAAETITKQAPPQERSSGDQATGNRAAAAAFRQTAAAPLQSIEA